MTRKRAIISLLVIAALATYTVAAAGLPNPLQLFGLGQEAAPTQTAMPQHRGPVSAAPPPSFAAIARAARPAVVNVSTTHTVRTQGFPGFGPGPFGEQDPFSEFFRRFFGPLPPRSFTQRALGSGVIIDRDGYIVTNAHVVKNADKIVIKLEDKREFDTKVVGIDGKTDVALLKIHAPEHLTVAPLGDSDALQVGDWVVAIGNPFGLSETVTAGIVSAKGRVIGEGPYDDFIQTDASINPGNSGGPLLDLHGTVVGINSAIFSRSGGNIGIGFAIPINMVKNVVAQLKKHHKVIRGWLGVAIQDVTPDLAKSFGLERAEGGLVGDVAPDSPAARAGFERGDIIIEYAGTHVHSAHQLPGLVAATEVGRTVPVKILRNGKAKTLTVTVGEMPTSTAASAAREGASDWGVAVSDITPELARQFQLTSRRGVVITAVVPDSPADDAGLRPGDVILQVDRRSVRTRADYQKAVARAGNAPRLLLLVQRQGRAVFVALARSR